MPANPQSAYALTLFLALASLKLWQDRRHRGTRAFRAGAARAVLSAF